jgi:protein CpxP
MKKLGKFQTLAIASLSVIALAAPIALAQSGKTDTEGQQSQDNGERGSGRGRHKGHGDGERGGFGRGERGGRGEGRMFRGLNLTDAQKAQMKQIRENFKAQIAPLREQLRGQRGEGRGFKSGETFNEAEATQRMVAAAPLRAKMMGESFKMRQALLAVLTPEQRTQMDQQKAERKARFEQMKQNWGNRSKDTDTPQKQ